MSHQADSDVLLEGLSCVQYLSLTTPPVYCQNPFPFEQAAIGSSVASAGNKLPFYHRPLLHVTFYQNLVTNIIESCLVFV